MEEIQQAHTPTPWKKRPHANGFSIISGDELNGNETVIARQLTEEDADRIIADRNAHDDLVKALAEAKDALFCGSPVTVGLENQINAALAKAKGGAA